MEAKQVVQKLTEPTEPTNWASYIVMMTKNEKVHICLDPTELNKALLREYYLCPTLEDVALSPARAQYVSMLDAASGF